MSAPRILPADPAADGGSLIRRVRPLPPPEPADFEVFYYDGGNAVIAARWLAGHGVAASVRFTPDGGVALGGFEPGRWLAQTGYALPAPESYEQVTR